MLKYEIVDNNKPEWVVFVHGIGGSTKTWNRQIEAFSEKYNLLLLDLPGHGSNSSKIIYKVDVNRLNKGICETMDHLHIESAHFVGLSLGTIVVAQFAIQYPQYVKKVIMGGAALLMKGITKSYVRFANFVKRLVPYKFLCKFFAWFILPKRNHQKSRNIFVREAIKLDRHTMYAWMDYLKTILHPEKLLTQLNALNKKILFISGDEDHCFLGGIKLIHDHLVKSKIKILEHCGHVCSIEQSVNFNQYAVAFLAA
ncbi:MAG: alpha/beta hydrolase [Agathobacter sp.]|nr:alpha/beta hydrolase [Agathobacter sp.]